MVRKLGMYVAPVLAMLPAGAAVAASGSAAPGSCSTWVRVVTPNPGNGDNDLFGVSATSARNAWAVGEYFVGVNTKTLIEHWNGRSWRVVASPNKGTGDSLKAVYALSATDVWAAGSYYNGTGGQTLIEHFNGKSWSVVPSPDIGAGSNGLSAIRGTSVTDIWAVGNAVTSYPVTKTVILRWNGHQWRVVPSPSVPGKPNFLTAVRPLSASDAWAVGSYDDAGSAARTLILRWSKGHWRIVSSPDVGTASNWLAGVRVTSATDAWAVGDYYDGTADKALILHWNGRRWRTSSGPSTQGSELSAIGGTSATNAYAVGLTISGTTSKTLIAHWDGKRWQAAPSPNPGTTGNYLDALYAQSPATVWAVGSYSNGGFNQTLIEECR